MTPRYTLPPAQTPSAREAMKSFYCQLCKKGYTRMNDYEAHLGSYDHSHTQRLKDMRAMMQDPTAAARARRQEAKNDGIISIKIGGGGGGGEQAGGGGGVAAAGVKKGGFKKKGFNSGFVPVSDAAADAVKAAAAARGAGAGAGGGGGGGGLRGRGGKLLRGGGASSSSRRRRRSRNSDAEEEGYDVYNPRFPTD